MRTAAILLTVVAVAVGCAAGLHDSREPSDLAYGAINVKVYQLARDVEKRYGIPREKLPKLRIDGMLVDHDGYTLCSDWEIWIDVRLVNGDLPFVLDVLLPHEYAHLVQCHQGLSDGCWFGIRRNKKWMHIHEEELHGPGWAEISTALGGPATDHRRRTS